MLKLISLIDVHPGAGGHARVSGAEGRLGVTFGWVPVRRCRFRQQHRCSRGCLQPSRSQGLVRLGVDLGFIVSPNSEVGFLYGQQPSNAGQGAAPRQWTSATSPVRTYHGTFTYNFFESDSRSVRTSWAGSAPRASARSTTAETGGAGPSRGLDEVLQHLGRGREALRPGRVGAASACTGHRCISSRMRPATGATPTGAATWWGRDSPTSSCSRAASRSGSDTEPL